MCVCVCVRFSSADLNFWCSLYLLDSCEKLFVANFYRLERNHRKLGFVYAEVCTASTVRKLISVGKRHVLSKIAFQYESGLSVWRWRSRRKIAFQFENGFPIKKRPPDSKIAFQFENGFSIRKRTSKGNAGNAVLIQKRPPESSWIHHFIQISACKESWIALQKKRKKN